MLFFVILLVGCGAVIPKYDYQQKFEKIDLYEVNENAKHPAALYYQCVPMTKEEYKNHINSIFKKCIESEFSQYPVKITMSEYMGINESVTTCTNIKLIKSLKNSIDFNISPEHSDTCKYLYDLAETLQ